MSDYPEPKPRLKVTIKTGPHGNRTELFIEGEKVTNARRFKLTGAVDDLARLTVEYSNVEVEVEALVDSTAMGDKAKSYQRMMLKPVERFEGEL